MTSKITEFKQATNKVKKLGEGSASLVYTDPENTNMIIKKAAKTRRNANGKYIKHQITGQNIIKKIRKSGYDYGVNLPEITDIHGALHIEKAITNKKLQFDKLNHIKQYLEKNSEHGYLELTPNQYIKETFLPGVMLHNAEYLKLKDITKDELATQLAQFLFAMHNIEKPKSATMQDRMKYILFNLQFVMQNAKNPEIIQNKTMDFINLFRNKQLKQYLFNSSKSLWQDIGEDEVLVMTHGDLRWPNIIYDKKHTKLGVIDFENAGIGHIYRDFVSSPVSFHWDFVQRIIKQYNKIQKAFNRHFRINTTNVKNLLILRVVNTTIKEIQQEIMQDKSLNIEKISKQELQTVLLSKIEPLLLQELSEYGLMEKPIIHLSKTRNRN